MSGRFRNCRRGRKGRVGEEKRRDKATKKEVWKDLVVEREKRGWAD